MATKYLRVWVQDLIVAALTGLPGVNVYRSDSFDGTAQVDPGKFPALVVSMPHVAGIEHLSQTLSRVSVRATVDLYDFNASTEALDKAVAEHASKVHVALASAYGAEYLRLGIFPNSVEVVDEGWGMMGQDAVYRFSVTYAAHVPTTEALSDG